MEVVKTTIEVSIEVNLILAKLKIKKTIETKKAKPKKGR